MATTMTMFSTPHSSSSSSTSAAALGRATATSSLHGFLPLHKAGNKTPLDQGSCALRKSNKKQNCRTAIQASYSTGDRSNNSGIFLGGFVLGGLIVGTLGCIYAPQISKALSESGTEDLMRKLPELIYDEEKALGKTRKILTEKIAQLNSAIDEISSQLRGNSSAKVGEEEYWGM